MARSKNRKVKGKQHHLQPWEIMERKLTEKAFDSAVGTMLQPSAVAATSPVRPSPAPVPVEMPKPDVRPSGVSERSKRALRARKSTGAANLFIDRGNGPSIEKLLLTVSETCAVLGISRSTLIRLDKSGEPLGRVQIGKVVRYSLQALRDYVHNRTKGN